LSARGGSAVIIEITQVEVRKLDPGYEAADPRESSLQNIGFLVLIAAVILKMKAAIGKAVVTVDLPAWVVEADEVVGERLVCPLPSSVSTKASTAPWARAGMAR
jgi:hypothetical protein